SFLFVTPAGNILMNSNYEASVPVIRANVEKLGFKFSDTKILIAGHAHPDHVEGDAMVKELTGAQVVVGRVDEAKTKEFRPGGKEHPINRLVDDGDTVTLGGTTSRPTSCLATPGAASPGARTLRKMEKRITRLSSAA